MKLKKLASKNALIQIITSNVSQGGVALLEEKNDIREQALVIQVADDVTEFKVGDTILFKSWALNNYKVNGEEFSIIKEEFYDGIL